MIGTAIFLESVRLGGFRLNAAFGPVGASAVYFSVLVIRLCNFLCVSGDALDLAIQRTMWFDFESSLGKM